MEKIKLRLTAHTVHTTINFTWTIDLNIDLQVYTKAKNQTKAKTNL